MRERLTWQPVYILGGVLVTTATAGLAVEPFSAYHFHNLTVYSALGNLLGGPPVDLLTMPAMIVALIAMPFGLDEWPLKAMGWGIDGMMIGGEMGCLDPRLADRRAGLSLRGAADHHLRRALADDLAAALAAIGAGGHRRWASR